MTEKLQPLSTQIAIPSQTLPPTVAADTSHDVAHKVEAVEEEPYTIRCICDYSDDDGNTIYCETCDTWQHIDCFYPDNREEALREDFAHSCNHCKPRPLDRLRAVARTRQLRNLVAGEPTDKKPATKRPPAKSHKKKPKPTDLLLNGNHTAHEATKHASPNEQPHPAKRPKHSHKPSQSSNNANTAKRSPSYGNSRSLPHGHPPSPATTPPDLPSEFEIHSYSEAFQSLFNDDEFKPSEDNSFATLVTSNTMSLWLREHGRLRPDTGHEFNDVFQRVSGDLIARTPPLLTETRKVAVTPDVVLKIKYLTTTVPIEKNVPLIELRGRIGFQKDYCADTANMWEELTSPLPFVFFHPMLPLYIDTRREGSLARYVRRSCKPNAMLETFLTNGGGNDYHFWLVSDRYIAPHEQITLPWDFRLPNKEKTRMLRFIGIGDDETNGYDELDIDELEYQHITNWVHRILSEYGGCACDLGSNCAFARFHRRYYSKLQARTAPIKKRSRKPKQVNHTISPTSTGQATNSRAPSEGHADDAMDDSRSTTGSAHSKPPSRDMTPAPRQGSFDNFTAILTEPTGRDKRKVAMVEDQFRAMEQPKPKKKRVSDGTTTAKPKSTKNATSKANGATNYVDAGTSQSKSGSPTSALSPGAADAFRQAASRQTSVGAASHAPPPARATYTNASTQTDPVPGAWYSPVQSPCKPKRIISLSRRLLSNRHQQKLVEEERRKSLTSLTAATQDSTPMDVDPAEPKSSLSSPVDVDKKSFTTSPTLSTAGDLVMADVTTTSPTGVKPPPITLVPPTASASTSPVKTSRSPDLRVQLPPVPAFGTGGSAVPTATTPLSANGSIVQSPFSTAMPSPFTPGGLNGTSAHQSPVRKKLSLSDYRRSKVDKTAASKSGSTKPSGAGADDTKMLDSIIDSPTAEKAAEGINGTTTVTTT